MSCRWKLFFFLLFSPPLRPPSLRVFSPPRSIRFCEEKKIFFLSFSFSFSPSFNVTHGRSVTQFLAILALPCCPLRALGNCYFIFFPHSPSRHFSLRNTRFYGGRNFFLSSFNYVTHDRFVTQFLAISLSFWLLLYFFNFFSSSSSLSVFSREVYDFVH